MTCPYANAIVPRLTKMGRTDINPALVECWMRLQYGTLDHLNGREFDAEVALAVACSDESTKEENDGLLGSYGY